MRKIILLIITHGFFAFAGFALGIYMLPILTAPTAPSSSDMAVAAEQARYTGQFRRDLAGSDFLHWGEGTVSVGKEYISLQGNVAPGPDYKLYLSPEFVETEADFNRIKPQMARLGDVKTFENFIIPVPETIDPEQYNAIIVWCEAFGEFITAARYK